MQLFNALQNDRYLIAVLALCQNHKAYGCNSVDCIDSMVAGDVDEEEEWNTPQRELWHHIDTLSAVDKLSVVPFLCRIGYSVLVWELDETTLPFTVDFPGKSMTPNTALNIIRNAPSGSTYYRSTAPGAQRLRGVMWCVPRLLRWKYRALQYYQGSLATLRAEGIAAHNSLM